MTVTNTKMKSLHCLEVSTTTVSRTRPRYVEAGLEAALKDKPITGQPSKFDGRHQAHLVAVACTPAPDGHPHWTVRLLADKAVELGFVESVSPETIRQLLKKRIETVATPVLVHPKGER
jgi:transposase